MVLGPPSSKPACLVLRADLKQRIPPHKANVSAQKKIPQPAEECYNIKIYRSTRTTTLMFCVLAWTLRGSIGESLLLFFLSTFE